jgi:hypothetical protein
MKLMLFYFAIIAVNITADAYVIFISGNDVYVSGFEGDGALSIVKTWKNGVRTHEFEIYTKTDRGRLCCYSPATC